MALTGLRRIRKKEMMTRMGLARPEMIIRPLALTPLQMMRCDRVLTPIQMLRRSMSRRIQAARQRRQATSPWEILNRNLKVTPSVCLRLRKSIDKGVSLQGMAPRNARAPWNARRHR
jgi:hypothetical protein